MNQQTAPRRHAVSLDGRTAVVSGAARGIGAALARGLAARGAAVAVVDLNDPASVAAAIIADGGTASAFTADLSVESEVEALGTSIREALGPVDIVVNNAAMSVSVGLAETDSDLWHRVLAVNLDSQFYMAKTFVPDMIERQHGRIINVSSTSIYATGGARLLPYRASKAGVLGLTYALASELGVHGITVNAVSPGFTPTEKVQEAIAAGEFPPNMVDIAVSMQSIKRPSRPEDLAGLVAFLASDDAEFITGKFIASEG